MLASLLRGLGRGPGRHRAGRARRKPHRNPPVQRRSFVPRLDVLEDRTLLSAGFGRSGIVTTDLRGPVISFATAVAVQPDGKTVVAGIAENGISRDFVLARYNANGSLDTSFGTGGKVTTDFGALLANPPAIALQPNGKIVMAGSVLTPPADNN